MKTIIAKLCITVITIIGIVALVSLSAHASRTIGRHQNADLSKTEIQSDKYSCFSTGIAIMSSNQIANKNSRPTEISLFDKYMPVTVIVAILLFVIREILERNKKNKQDKNKLQAIKHLISNELKNNKTALTYLKQVYDMLEHLYEVSQAPKVFIHTNKFGDHSFHYQFNDDVRTRSHLPLSVFAFDTYKSQLPPLAELDIAFAKEIEKTYSNLIEMDNYKKSLIISISNGLEYEIMTKIMIPMFNKKYAKCDEMLSDCYLKLTNTPIS